MAHTHKSHIEEDLGELTYCKQSVIEKWFTFIEDLVMTKLEKDDLLDYVSYGFESWSQEN